MSQTNNRRVSSVLLYGDFYPERLATSYERAFVAHKVNVVRFDTRDMPQYLAPYVKQRHLHRLTIKSLLMRRLGAAKWNARFVEVCRQSRPDLVFILNGQFLMPETLRRVRESGTRVFIFYADNPFPPFPNVRPEMEESIRECDCYFIWSRSLVERLLKVGAPRAEFLGFAWDETIFPARILAPVPEHDLIFIGGWDKEREEFLEPLARQFALKIWGPPYWKTRTQPQSALRASWQGREVAGDEISHIISRSKIVLNVLRDQNLPDGVIMRTFEVPGCGGFMLSTRTSGAQEIFPEQSLGDVASGGAYYSDLNECQSQIEYFLAHEDQRHAIAQRSHEIVSHGHQFHDRVRQILSVAQNN